jgi:hypothetical protein
LAFKSLMKFHCFNGARFSNILNENRRSVHGFQGSRFVLT